MSSSPPARAGRSGAPVPGELGHGPLGRATSLVHWALVLTVLFVLTSLPGSLGSLLVEPSASNVPLLMLCVLPFAPALSATLFAWRDRLRDDDAAPWPSFWRGYRLGARDAVRVAVPALLVLGAVSWSVLNIGSAGTPPGYAWILLAIGTGLALVSVQALVITTFFSFRARDVWRLAVFHTLRMPLVSVGVVALGVCVGGLLWLTNEAVAVLAAGAVSGLLLRYELPMLERVQAEFTSADVTPGA